MKVVDVSVSELGIQIVTNSYYPTYQPDVLPIVSPRSSQWPRFLACGQQLKNMYPQELEDVKLVEVRQKQFIGGKLQRQFSFTGERHQQAWDEMRRTLGRFTGE